MAIDFTLLHISLFVIAYFLGAIPFSLLISKIKGIDLRKVGSGNFGATNVYRAMGLFYAVLVFSLDVLKAFIPTYLAMQYFPNIPFLHIGVGFTAVMGHSLSVFLNFKGGKGAACGVGVLCAISPVVSLIVFTLSVLLIVTFKYVAPVTILSSLLTPILLWVFDAPFPYIISVGLVCVFIIYRHRSNISRLIQGKENKI